MANGCEGRGFLFGLTRLAMSIDVFIIIIIVLFVWNICDISVRLTILKVRVCSVTLNEF